MASCRATAPFWPASGLIFDLNPFGIDKAHPIEVRLRELEQQVQALPPVQSMVSSVDVIDRLLYWLALGLVKFFQALPLGWVARIGRAGGTLADVLDARHRRVAIENLSRCLG